jgi:O-antigen/teichoic acid export membrane protein
LIRRIGSRLARRSAIWVAIGTIGASGMSFLFQGYLSVILPDAAFGSISSAIVMAVALSIFLSAGAQNVMLDLVKRQSMDVAAVLARFRRLWLIHSALSIALSAAAFMVLNIDATGLYFIAALTAFLSLTIILGAARQSADDFRGVGTYLLAPEIGKLMAVGVAALVGAQALASNYLVFGSVFLLLAFLPLLSPAFWRKWNTGPSYRTLVTTGFPYALAGFLFMVYYRSTLVIFSGYGRLEEAGSLAIIYLFMTGILLLPTAYSQRYLLGRWHAIPRHETGMFRKELKRQILSLLAFSLPLGLGWFFLSTETLSMIYGDRYAHAREYAPWFALVFVFRSLCIPLQAACSVDNLKWAKTWMILLAALATVGLSLALAPAYGMLGGVISGIAAETILLLGLSALVLRHTRR